MKPSGTPDRKGSGAQPASKRPSASGAWTTADELWRSSVSPTNAARDQAAADGGETSKVHGPSSPDAESVVRIVSATFTAFGSPGTASRRPAKRRTRVLGREASVGPASACGAASGDGAPSSGASGGESP
ncbi:MAG: hypothetical protein KIS78_01620 [Labilithrix sp.]|nr:hypothetical protein [Labilithrix sp.]